MFNRKINARVEELERLVTRLFCRKLDEEDIVGCETCGCLIKIKNAVKGKSEVRVRYDFIHHYYHREVENIHVPYFCKRCTPKTEEEIHQ